MTEPLAQIWNGKGGVLPLAPLVPLIIRDAAILHAQREHDRGTNYAKPAKHPGLYELAEAVGTTERKLRAYVTGEFTTIALDVADAYMCATGRHLRDVWPWLYTTEQIDADVWATTHEDEYWVWRREVRAEQQKANARAWRARKAVTA